MTCLRTSSGSEWHTWATIALASSVHPRVVQERLGHARISVTLQTYSHAQATMHDDAAVLVAKLRSNLDMETAFSRLRLYVRNHNRRLAEVAADILSGTLGTDVLGIGQRPGS
jgi:hypothetical protein